MAIRPHGMNTKTKQKWKDCDNKEWRGCGSEYVWKLVVHQVPRIGSTCGFLDDVPAHSVGWLILSHYFLLETEDLEPLSSSNDVNNGSTDEWFGICRKPLTFHEVTENLIEFGSFISGSPPHFISVHLKLTFLRDFLSEFHHLFSSFFNIIILTSTNHPQITKKREKIHRGKKRPWRPGICVWRILFELLIWMRRRRAGATWDFTRTGQTFFDPTKIGI